MRMRYSGKKVSDRAVVESSLFKYTFLRSCLLCILILVSSIKLIAFPFICRCRVVLECHISLDGNYTLFYQSFLKVFGETYTLSDRSVEVIRLSLTTENRMRTEF